MPGTTINPQRESAACSILSTSVGSASSLLLSSETDAAERGKMDSMSSLKNGYLGSWATLAEPIHPRNERSVSLTANAISVSQENQLNYQHANESTPTHFSAERRVSSAALSAICEHHDSKSDPGCHDDDSSEEGGGGSYRRFGEKKDDDEPRKWDVRQWLLLTVLSLATLTSSFAICLFPPFFPRIAEEKGASASLYGLIIGMNCLTTFIVTPFIGKNLKYIGVRFAFVSGVFIGGVCCMMSGFLEWFPPGISFTVMSIAIRIIHAAGNAGTITSTFTYTAVEFPNSVAKIFSLTRTMMNIAQLAGPIIGGALYEIGGFKMPFIIMGCIQTVMAFITYPFLPDYDPSLYDKGSSNKSVSPLAILCIPSIWIPFFTFIVSTVCNGFLSINLEPQVLRKFDLTPFYVGIFFGLKDGANSIASPVWGYLCDRKGSVKFCLLISTSLGALSIFLLGPFPGVPIDRDLTVVGIALALSGISFAGQQVSGVVDAMREAVHAGYPDNPSTHGLVAGIWSSLSGLGRFVSRAGTGVSVDYIGFQMTAVVVFCIQIIVALATICYTMPKCRRSTENGISVSADVVKTRTASFNYSVVDVGEYPRVMISQPESPTDCLTCRSVSIPLPRHCSVRRLRAETYAGFPR